MQEHPPTQVASVPRPVASEPLGAGGGVAERKGGGGSRLFYGPAFPLSGVTEFWCNVEGGIPNLARVVSWKEKRKGESPSDDLQETLCV